MTWCEPWHVTVSLWDCGFQCNELLFEAISRFFILFILVFELTYYWFFRKPNVSISEVSMNKNFSFAALTLLTEYTLYVGVE